jgi:hypothetical protein
MKLAIGLVVGVFCSAAVAAEPAASDIDGHRIPRGALDARPEPGMVLNAASAAIVVDSNAGTVRGSVSLSGGTAGDCAISPDGRLGFATDFNYRVWVIDLASTPPQLAAGTNPISISNPGEDVALTADGRFLVVCDGYSVAPVSVVDVGARAQVTTFNFTCNAVDVCADGSVLVASWDTSQVRRFVIDATGHLTDTGESLITGYPMNVYCSPDAHSGIVMAGFGTSIRSFRIPGMAPVSERTLSQSDHGNSGAMASDGTRFYARTFVGTVAAFDYDQATGVLGAAPIFTRSVGPVTGYYGVEQMALDHRGEQLYVPDPYRLGVFDPASGAALPELAVSQLPTPTGICFRTPRDRDGDGLDDSDEIAQGTDPDHPDSDGDGLLDGFEVRYGFDPLVSGEQAQDPDGDGLDNLAEQSARTNPTDPDTDDDGLDDGQEVHVTGTNPRDPDTDHDGVADATDNCPTRANGNQADAVHPNGIGDACDDPDQDAVFDATDNCPDLANADQVNPDGDVLGSACDPYPDHALKAKAIAPDDALTGEPVPVTYRLVDPATDVLLDGLVGVRVTLTLRGSAVFGGAASQGVLVSGGGTNRALVEFVHGLVTLAIGDGFEEVVTLGGEDTDHNGIVVPLDVFESFEASGGALTHSGTNDAWEWGAPTSGPGYAASGINVWATNLSGDYPNSMNARLVTPRFRLDQLASPRLEFQSWFSSEGCCDEGTVVVSTDGFASWNVLGVLHGFQGGYQWKSYNLSGYLGSEIQVGLSFQSNGAVTAPGWYVDDFTIRGNGKTIQFLSPDGDLDADGATNSEELAHGTDPHDPDTDDDGIADGSDNCPVHANADQSDAVHPNGTGDACDDPDHDGVFDLTDNCPDASNADQADAEGDGAGDVCDPSPNYPLEAMPTGSNFALTGQPMSITYRLVDRRNGRLMAELAGVRVTLTVDGSAVFGTSASQGLLIGGGGTNRVLVEFVQGLVTLSVLDRVGEVVRFGGEDSEQNGIAIPSDVFQDFEASDGAFTHVSYGGPWDWEWGPPTNGPGQAASGVNAWGVNGYYSFDGFYAVLVSPRFGLGPATSPRLEFKNWFYGGSANFDYGVVQVSTDGFVTGTTLVEFRGDLGGYALKSYDLSAFAGSNIQLRFLLSSFRSYTHWYVDDFEIRGAAKTMEFLASPEEDLDGDGLTNADEVARGTSPRDADTDDDELNDAAEINVYGTNPLAPDTDGGGVADGNEIYQRTNPLDPADDHRPEYGMVMTDYWGAEVIESHTRADLGNVYLAPGALNGDCVISPDGALGFTTDSNSRVWVVDLASTPARIAPGTNPIVISGAGGDLAATPDGRFLVACAGYPNTTLSVIDAAARAERGTFDLGAICSAVDVCRDGSVLVASNSTGRIRRLVIDAAGNVSDTGESLAASGPVNVYCSPDGQSGVAVTSQSAGSAVRSFRVPGMAPVSQRSLSGANGVSGVMARDGTRFYARSLQGAVDAFEFDPATAVLGIAPLFTLSVGSARAWTGFEEIALDYEGGRLYVPEYHKIDIFDSVTGARLPDLTSSDLQPTSLCFRSPRDRDGDGLSDDDEAARGTDPDNPDTDGDGLLDGFEDKYGLNPLVPGEQAQDPDGDGLDNMAEQSAHTNPTDPDTDDDGLGDGVEILVAGTNPRDPDTDHDGIVDGVDNCPTRTNANQADAVHPNGIGDACDDPDQDGLFDVADNCPSVSNASQADADGDASGDACDPCTDPDADGFGSPGSPVTTCPIDNCAAIANADQADRDQDGSGDSCDNCLDVSNPDQSNVDGDQDGDLCDSCPHVPGRTLVDAIVNGTFETGDLSGWTVENHTFGSWVVNSGTINPSGPTGPTAPVSGQFDALTIQTGPGRQHLSQLVSVPSNIQRATLSWSDRVLNYASTFVHPTQEWRVQIRADQEITDVFSTRPGDPLIQPGPNTRSFDVTGLLQSLQGRQVRIAFEQEDSLNYFNVALDDVHLVIETGIDCHAPVADAGADQALECSGPAGASVRLNGDGSTDADSTPGSNDDIGSFEWFEDIGTATQRSLGTGEAIETALPVGSHHVTLGVTDRAGESDTDETTIAVLDTVAPTIACPASVTTECQAAGLATIVLAPATSADACFGTATMANDRTPGGADASDSYPLGRTEVTFTATDGAGNTSRCVTVVTVVDTVAPVVTVDSAPNYLWPPNHAMHGVHDRVLALDACDPSPRVFLDAIVSSEPDDAADGGDGRTTDDIQGASIGTADFDVLLRAERAATGPGRTYTIRYRAADASGNSGAGSDTVSVPHDQDGIDEPIVLSVSGRTSTVVSWEPVYQAQHFDVIRGRLDQLRAVGSNFELGAVTCLQTNVVGDSSVGSEDASIPDPGNAFFYLVQFYDAAGESSYGEPSAHKARVMGAGSQSCH